MSTVHFNTPPPPQSHTFCIFYTLGRGGGGRRSERRYSRGATVHKYSSIVHGATVQFTSWFENNWKKSRHIGFGVFIVHSSMSWPKAKAVIGIIPFYWKYYRAQILIEWVLERYLFNKKGTCTVTILFLGIGLRSLFPTIRVLSFLRQKSRLCKGGNPPVPERTADQKPKLP